MWISGRRTITYNPVYMLHITTSPVHSWIRKSLVCFTLVSMGTCAWRLWSLRVGSCAGALHCSPRQARVISNISNLGEKSLCRRVMILHEWILYNNWNREIFIILDTVRKFLWDTVVDYESEFVYSEALQSWRGTYNRNMSQYDYIIWYYMSMSHMPCHILWN